MANTRLSGMLFLKTGAAAQYANYNFNSYAVVAGKILAANEDGIFVLDVTDKDEASVATKYNIDSIYESGPTDFGVRTEKRIRKAVVTLEVNGQVEMVFKVAEGEDDQVEVRKLPYYDDNREHVVEVPVGRDLKGRFFSWIIKNVDGADFSIDEIEGFVDVLLRKPEKEGAN